MAYATEAEYEAYTGSTAPTNIGLMLTRASRSVDQALLCAVYSVDEDGNPTDLQHVAALRDATCEQVAGWAAAGEDGTGASEQYADVQIGSVRLARASGANSGGSSATRLAPQAWMILQQAGLVGGLGPWTH